jgi:hypothetical protein|tara:strand:- start:20 stop:313 length:294 start_codon:yes stop_codon:yes gene_type:complete
MSEIIKNFEGWLDGFSKEKLGDKLMEMPELETPAEEEEIYKELHSINTFHAFKNEVCLRGKDENDNDFNIYIDAYDFIKWVDMPHIKKTLKKYITKI